MRIFVSLNIFHVHSSIMICTSKILQQQKQTFEQIYSKFYKTTHLQFQKENVVQLFQHMYDCDHRYPNHPQIIGTNYCHTWLLASTNDFHNNRKIHGTSSNLCKYRCIYRLSTPDAAVFQTRTMIPARTDKACRWH
jgi:hypothetical protein